MHSAFRRFWLVVATLLAMAGGTHSAAAVIPLGQVSAATTLHFGMGGLLGPFEHFYAFTIEPGKVFEVTSLSSTGFGNRAFVPDFNGDISDASGIVAAGDSRVLYLPPFPAYAVVFDPFTLGAGDYILRLAGTAVSSWPDAQIRSNYDGTITFADVAASVPEPGSLALVALAIVGLGVRGRFMFRP